MKKPVSIVKVAMVLAVFAPAALLPAAGRAALLSSPSPSAAEAAQLLERAAAASLTESGLSRDRAKEVLESLTPAEIRMIASAGPLWRAGGEGEGVRDSLMSNETAAIVLTLLMLAVVIGAVEINRR